MQKVSVKGKTAVTTPAKTAILNHLAIIPDGNRRWAKNHGVSVFEGYRKGAKRGIEVARRARGLGIHTLTFWGLSTDNWHHRPAKELKFIVRLLITEIDNHLKEAAKYQVRMVHLGRKDRLPKRLVDKVRQAEHTTKNYTQHILNLALDYGGHDELVRAAKKMIKDAKAGKLKPADLNKPVNGHEGRTIFDSYLDTGNQPFPNPDLVIRTSGEIRSSGYLAAQSGYAEFHFEPTYWPDFTKDKLDQAIEIFRKRERRFGGDY